MGADSTASAFYARTGSPLSDWWTLLHPPYTVWHLGYVVLGAALAPDRDWAALAMSLVAFLLAVGVAAHALDELRGRPLNTRIPARRLWAAAVLALSGAVSLGVVGVAWHGFDGHGFDWVIAAMVPLGVALVVGYNLELFGGRLHTDLGFALAWGGFPVLLGYAAQSPPHSVPLLLAVAAAAAAASGTAYAQRCLSTPARQLRRRAVAVTGTVTLKDGGTMPLDRQLLLTPLETALRALSWAVPLIAVAVLLARA